MLELLALSAFVLAAVSAVFLALLVGRRVALARREQEFAAARARLLPLALALVEGTETVPAGQLSRRDEEVLADLLGELSRRLRGDSRVRIAAHFRGSAALRHELAALSSRRSWKRASAASRLGDMAAVSALPALREALDDEERDVRSAAARSLGLLGDVVSAPRLVQGLADGSIPRDNPTIGGVRSHSFSYGHRNPQGIDWSPTTGALWESEHGATGNDEINVIDAGVNYGWPLIEGNQTLPGMREPITFYTPAIAPSGASFYRGQRFAQFAGNLFVGTLRGTHLLRLRLDAPSRQIVGQERLLDGQFGRIRDVISGPDGYLYFCTNNRDGRGTPVSGDDRIVRLVPAS